LCCEPTTRRRRVICRLPRLRDFRASAQVSPRPRIVHTRGSGAAVVGWRRRQTAPGPSSGFARNREALEGPTRSCPTPGERSTSSAAGRAPPNPCPSRALHAPGSPCSSRTSHRGTGIRGLSVPPKRHWPARSVHLGGRRTSGPQAAERNFPGERRKSRCLRQLPPHPGRLQVAAQLSPRRTRAEERKPGHYRQPLWSPNARNDVDAMTTYCTRDGLMTRPVTRR